MKLTDFFNSFLKFINYYDNNSNIDIRSHKLKSEKADIIKWLKKYNINNFNLIPDIEYGFVVDVHSDVNLCDKNLKHILVKFNNVNGSFDCSNNKLTSLEFCPSTVNGNFYCHYNKLTRLEFCPKIINGNFYYDGNKLIGVDMGKLYDYKEIYKIHTEHKITAEKSKLENNILNKSKDNNINKRNRRIKI